MLDCPFDDCLSFEESTPLATHLEAVHLTGADEADALSIEQLLAAIATLREAHAAQAKIQRPRAFEVLQAAIPRARSEAELGLRLDLRLALEQAEVA